MKTLHQHIYEWKANTNTMSSIEKQDVSQYFIYELKILKKIRIFNLNWPQFEDYKDKVYINNKKLDIDSSGYTDNKFGPGIYKVEIEDIDNVTNCQYMFFNCTDLVKVQLFDTHKVEDMNRMFSYCYILKDVPLLDTRNVKNMSGMFYNCNNLKDIPNFNTTKVKNMSGMFCYCDNLSENTKKEWSKIYNFKTHNKR